jgi:Alternative complex III, ActD subunit
MSDRLLLATFSHEDDVLDATRAVRQAGYSIVDVYAPYAVHGLDEAMGLRPSRLTWVCFVCGALGVLGMFLFEQWTAAISWPINVGGKPWNSWPSDVPVAFEALVFMASFGSVFAFLLVSRLFAGKRSRPFDLRTTDDRFVLVIDETDASFDLSNVQRLLAQYRVVSTEERLANGETGR